MTIHWKAVEQYFAVVLFVFKFYPVYNFGLSTVRRERAHSDYIQIFTYNEVVLYIRQVMRINNLIVQTEFS